ncbi:hypothetical protein ACWC9H_12890 [Streptomyces sp. NPDC001251]|uniref:hypothetical protein n=1 Tax=Streptomyces sp. CB01201 TaxID=2020324 RepID=UPI002689701A
MEWDSTTHLLAAAVDHLAVANWMTATINSGEDADPLDYPEAVPRPGMTEGHADPSPHPDQEPDQGSGMPTPTDLARFFS